MTSSDEWRSINSSEQALCLARKWATEGGQYYGNALLSVQMHT